MKTLLDSSASCNFVRADLIDQNTVDDAQAQRFTVVNSASVRSTGITTTTVQMSQFTHTGGFHVTPTLAFDVTLGIPFLSNVDPVVQWRKHTMRVDEHTVRASERLPKYTPRRRIDRAADEASHTNRDTPDLHSAHG